MFWILRWRECPSWDKFLEEELVRVGDGTQLEFTRDMSEKGKARSYYSFSYIYEAS
jgi:hypothetical protein